MNSYNIVIKTSYIFHVKEAVILNISFLFEEIDAKNPNRRCVIIYFTDSETNQMLLLIILIYRNLQLAYKRQDQTN